MEINHTNVDQGDFNYSVGDPAFFKTYYSLTRFAIETCLASLAVLVNSTTLLAVRCSKAEITLSQPLFLNLVIVNILSAALPWFCNNLLFLFEEQIVYLMNREKLCRVTLMALGALLPGTLLGIMSTLTLLGFAIIQCVAINKPLHYTGIVTKRKVNIYLLTTWLVTVAATVLPMLIVVVVSENRECTVDVLKELVFVITLNGNIGNGIIALICIAIIGLCIKVYVDIHRHWERIHHFRQRWELQRNWKAFVTTALLVSSLTLFFLPNCIAYLLNCNDMVLIQESSTVTYIMNMLPYVKFITDPVIYGMRTKEVREGCRRVRMNWSSLKRQTSVTGHQLHYTSSFMTSSRPESPGSRKQCDIALEPLC